MPFDTLNEEQLNLILDTFGRDSQTAKDMLKASQEAALTETFSNLPNKTIIPVTPANTKSAEEAAQVLQTAPELPKKKLSIGKGKRVVPGNASLGDVIPQAPEPYVPPAGDLGDIIPEQAVKSEVRSAEFIPKGIGKANPYLSAPAQIEAAAEEFGALAGNPTVRGSIEDLLGAAGSKVAPVANKVAKVFPTFARGLGAAGEIASGPIGAAIAILDEALTSPEAGSGSDQPVGKQLNQSEMLAEGLKREQEKKRRLEMSDMRKYFTNGTFDFEKFKRLNDPAQQAAVNNAPVSAKEGKSSEFFGPAAMPNPAGAPSDDEYKKSLKPESAPNSEPSGAPKQEKSDQTYSTDFLARISRNESGLGANTNHRVMGAGEPHAGQHAIGVYGLMPDTVEEMSRRLQQEGNEDPKLAALINLKMQKFPELVGIENSDNRNSPEIMEMQGKYTEEMQKMLQESPELYNQLAEKLQKHVMRDTQDPRIGAYRWLNGHNLDLKSIPDKDLAESDYVKKFSADLDPNVMVAEATKGQRLPAGAVPQQAVSDAASKDALSNLMDTIYGPRLGMEALREAQSVRDQTNLLAGMTAAGGKIAEALSRGAYKSDSAIPEAIRKSANAGIENIDQGRKLVDQNMAAKLKLSDLNDKMAMRDPSSPLSAAYRSVALQLKPELAKDPNFPQMSAEAVKNLHSMVETMVRLQGIKDAKERAKSEEKEKDVNRRFEKLGERISSEKAGSRTGLGSMSKVFRAAQQVEKMVQGRDPNELDTREIAEMARQLDAILSGGSPTISGMKKLIPEASSGDVTKIQEYLLSKRKGAGMGSFVNQLMDTVAREKELASEQLVGAQMKLIAGSLDLARDYPERWDTIMQYHGLPTAEEFLATAGKKSGSPTSQKTSNIKTAVTNEEAKKYYDMYKNTHPTLTLEAARAILEKRKAQQGK